MNPLPASYPFHDLNLLVFDAETTWSKDYTLSKLSTSEYVRDPRFKMFGASVINQGTGDELWLTGDELDDYLRRIDWGNTALLCQNTMFDGFILHEHYDIHPARYLDTKGMAKAIWGIFVRNDLNSIAARCGLGTKIAGVLDSTKGLTELEPAHLAELGKYCIQDSVLTLECFEHMMHHELFTAEELYVIDYTLRAFCDPKLLINRALAEAELADEQNDKARLLKREEVTATQISSNPQFAQLLIDHGLRPGEIPKKVSPATGKMTFAFAKTDEDFRALEEDPAVAGLVECRLRVKSTIVESKARRLIAHGDPGPLPIGLTYWAAHTRRWGGTDKLNPQNFPAGRRGQTQRLRNSILAPPGYVLISVDSSQIEPRYLAYMCDNEPLLEVFRRGDDPYLWMASKLYGEDYDDPEKYNDERRLGKAVLIALGYGMGVTKFIFTAKAMFGLELDLALATEVHRLYRTTEEDTTLALWDKMDDMLYHMATCAAGDFKHIKTWAFDANRIWMSTNYAIHYPDLQVHFYNDRRNFSYQGRKKRAHIYAAKSVENVVQGDCCNVVAYQGIEIAKRYQIVLLAHDEIVYLAREEDADEALAFGIKEMSKPPSWAPDLPVAATGYHSPYYRK